MARKEKIITPAMAKRHWGKHYGVGFMSSIGFKCTKVSADLYDVVKHTYSVNGRIVSVMNVGQCKKKDFMTVAMHNGFNPRCEMESEGPAKFQYIYDAGTGTKSKEGYTERFTNTL